MLEHSKSRGDTDRFSSCSLSGGNTVEMVGMGLTSPGDWWPILPPRVDRDKEHSTTGLVPLAVGILGLAAQGDPEFRWLLSLRNHWLLRLGDDVGHHLPHLTFIPAAALPSKHSCSIMGPEMGTFLLRVAAPTPEPGCTDLPIPEVTAAGCLEHEDVVGVEGRGTGRHLEGFSVVFIGAMDMEEAGGGCGLLAALP